MAKHPPAKMSAVLGRCRRTGRWRLGARSTVLALLGSVRLDMRSSFVEGEAGELKMKVTVFLGSAVFILPEGAEVRPSGMSLLSAEWVDVPEHEVPSGLPTLEIEWTCVLGRVHVITGSVLERPNEKDQVEEAEYDDEVGADPAPYTPAPAPVPTYEAADEAPEPWSAADTDPTPALDVVPDVAVDMGPVDMGDGDAEPWSASVADPAEPPVADAAEEAATPVVEAWRTHDWGDGIQHAPGDDEPGDEAETAAPAEPAATAEPGEADGSGGGAPLVEAWRTHDWGDGIQHPDGEDDEDDDAPAPAKASA